ncbi:MAG TPA: TlpA disulfide reductase family protein [Pirellulales bacterium]|nr:TlpA disulfide reductase family protein [Pirellulales bacterium]
MGCTLSNRRIWAAMLFNLAVGMIAWQIQISRAADDSSTGKSTSAKASAGKASAAASDLFNVPDGKQQAQMAFIAKMRRLKPPKNASDDDKKDFLTKSHSAMLEAADKVLDSKPASALRVAAIKAKIEALLALKDLGDDSATKKLSDLADELKDDKQNEVVKLVRPYVGLAKAEETAKVASKNSEKPPRSWAEIRPKIAAAPDDKDLAKEAIQSVSMLERSGSSEAAKAYQELAAIFSKSKDPQIAAEARSLEGIVRRLTLPGKPIEINGHLVDGSPVNVNALKGKVVLVDFWATWCGPCKAELPNVQANYEKYHSRGFEVVGVSCDQDKEALVKFIEEQKLPWPIIFQQQGEPTMASYYGITGIPTAILTNNKGEVISLNARGEELTRLLAQMLGR